MVRSVQKRSSNDIQVQFFAGLQVIVVFTIFCNVNIAEDVNRSSRLNCTDDTYYKVRRDGTAHCKSCQKCTGGGIGWNESFVRDSSRHGFMNCYPCAVCPPGTYRKYDSVHSRCQTCVLNCLELHRYESVKCGGATDGHCGDCLPGLSALSSSANSRCTNQTGDKGVVPVGENLQEVSTGKDKQQETFGTFGIQVVIFIVLAAVFVVVLVAVVCRLKHLPRRRKGPGNNAVEHKSSTQKLMGSNESNLQQANDIEEDGVGSLYVRGELPTTCAENELAAVHSKDSDRLHQKKPPVNEEICYHNRQLELNDETLSVAARNIYGEKRHELFRYLELEDAKTNPEEERWDRHKVEFAEYVLEVLKIWLKINGRKADLKWLVNALKKASFDQAVKKILDLQENNEHIVNKEGSLDKIVIEVQSSASLV